MAAHGPSEPELRALDGYVWYKNIQYLATKSPVFLSVVVLGSLIALLLFSSMVVFAAFYLVWFALVSMSEFFVSSVRIGERKSVALALHRIGQDLELEAIDGRYLTFLGSYARTKRMGSYVGGDGDIFRRNHMVETEFWGALGELVSHLRRAKKEGKVDAREGIKLKELANSIYSGESESVALLQEINDGYPEVPDIGGRVSSFWKTVRTLRLILVVGILLGAAIVVLLVARFLNATILEFLLLWAALVMVLGMVYRMVRV